MIRDAIRNELERRGHGARAKLAREVGMHAGDLTRLLRQPSKRTRRGTIDLLDVLLASLDLRVTASEKGAKP